MRRKALAPPSFNRKVKSTVTCSRRQALIEEPEPSPQVGHRTHRIGRHRERGLGGQRIRDRRLTEGVVLAREGGPSEPNPIHEVRPQREGERPRVLVAEVGHAERGRDRRAVALDATRAFDDEFGRGGGHGRREGQARGHPRQGRNATAPATVAARRAAAWCRHPAGTPAPPEQGCQRRCSVEVRHDVPRPRHGLDGLGHRQQEGILPHRARRVGHRRGSPSAKPHGSDNAGQHVTVMRLQLRIQSM